MEASSHDDTGAQTLALSILYYTSQKNQEILIKFPDLKAEVAISLSTKSSSEQYSPIEFWKKKKNIVYMFTYIDSELGDLLRSYYKRSQEKQKMMGLPAIGCRLEDCTGITIEFCSGITAYLNEHSYLPFPKAYRTLCQHLLRQETKIDLIGDFLQYEAIFRRLSNEI